MITTALITRTELGLGDLDINDQETNGYKLSSDLAFNITTWRREQVRSPYVHGAITVGRVKDVVETTIAVEVYATTYPQLRNRVRYLVEAFTQDQFFLTITLDGTEFKWRGEAADYGMNWERERLHVHQALVAFQFPRDPEPITGPI